MTDFSQSLEQLDPDYEHHGGFPEYGAASPGPGFGRFVTAMRGLQDLAVSADVFGMVVHAAGRPISRTGFLHVDYCKITPIDIPLVVRGHVAATEGRKAFVRGELVNGDTLLAEANGLMVRLLPGQP